MEYTKGECQCWIRREGKDVGETPQCSKCLAAPDLYEALKVVREYFGDKIVTQFMKDGTIPYFKEYPQVVKALAKANKEEK